MQLDLHQLQELLATLDQTNISELILKSGDLELTVRKGVALGDRPLSSISTSIGDGAAGTGTSSSPSANGHPSSDSGLTNATPIGGTTAVPPSKAPLVNPKWVDIISPVVGTFYRASGPDEAPFVEKGDRISVGQVVCIIEAMKVMNEIEAEVSGEIVEILVENGEPVEYNQPLMRVNPD